MRAALPLLLALLAPAAASAQGMSRTDRLRTLYSNQFSFDRRGVPMITVRIAEGLSKVVVRGARPPRLLPDGEGGAEVSAGRSWQISLVSGKPAEVEHFAVLERLPAGDLAAVQAAAARWRARKVATKTQETGAVFGVKGQVFDTRAYLLVTGPYPSRKRAEAVSEAHKERYELDKVATVARLKRRPSGELRAEALDGGTTTVRLHDVVWLAPSGGGKLEVLAGDGARARAYWGRVYVAVDSGGKLAVVNAVPADRLLEGLVPAEIFPSAPMEALKAQAVAARGELLAKLGGRHLEDPYLLCADQHCQVYAGAGHEHPRTTRAVAATRGKVLVKKSGALVDTVYSAVCGGHTEHNDKAWPSPPDPNLRGHLDGDPRDPALAPFVGGITEQNIARWLAARPPAWCGKTRQNRSKFRWTRRLGAAAVNRMVGGLGVGRVEQLTVLERGISGRAVRLEVRGNRGKARVRGELRIRRLLGGLRSGMFVVRAEGGAAGRPAAFVFTGGGWGHGVGMCQTGAIGMADAGRTYQQILEHYYQGSLLKPLY